MSFVKVIASGRGSRLSARASRTSPERTAALRRGLGLAVGSARQPPGDTPARAEIEGREPPAVCLARVARVTGSPLPQVMGKCTIASSANFTVKEIPMATGTCPHCEKTGKHLKRCKKCGDVTCGGNSPCGHGFCPRCKGHLESTR